MLQALPVLQNVMGLSTLPTQDLIQQPTNKIWHAYSKETKNVHSKTEVNAIAQYFQSCAMAFCLLSVMSCWRREVGRERLPRRSLGKKSLSAKSASLSSHAVDYILPATTFRLIASSMPPTTLRILTATTLNLMKGHLY